LPPEYAVRQERQGISLGELVLLIIEAIIRCVKKMPGTENARDNNARIPLTDPARAFIIQQ
jgi:hypothetical protein